MRRLFTFMTALLMTLGLGGCDQPPAAPKATPASYSLGLATAIPSPSLRAARPAAPVEISRETRLWTGPSVDALELGKRPAGTPITVFNIAGDRFLIVEHNRAEDAAWVDIVDVAMGQDDWAALAPPRTETVLALCLPAAASTPPTVTAKVVEHTAAYMETFLVDKAPALTMVVRTGEVADAATLHIRIQMPTLELVEVGPKPAIWDRIEYEKWKRRVEENQRRTEEYQKKVAAIRSQVESFNAELGNLRVPKGASSTGCLAQAARTLGPIRVPTQIIVIFVNLGEAETPKALPLQGMRVSLLTYCANPVVACQAAEDNWHAALRQAGVLWVRSVEAAGPFARSAFLPATPVIRQ